VETYNINNVSKDVLDMVEADTFWCMSKLLDGIQDNYTFAQPGIQMKVSKLQHLITRIDGKLYTVLCIQYMLLTINCNI